MRVSVRVLLRFSIRVLQGSIRVCYKGLGFLELGSGA